MVFTTRDGGAPLTGHAAQRREDELDLIRSWIIDSREILASRIYPPGHRPPSSYIPNLVFITGSLVRLTSQNPTNMLDLAEHLIVGDHSPTVENIEQIIRDRLDAGQHPAPQPAEAAPEPGPPSRTVVRRFSLTISLGRGNR
ncbi:hypothetical protein [Actinomadura yumaensis]|uniref:Uncharacterized protein n=1 Tax=Actinomadura yumaensis TaxID=111807 RepID=A0ABW2CPM4_9ACTN